MNAHDYNQGMRESAPQFCWRYLEGKHSVCIRDRGHDNGVHEGQDTWTVPVAQVRAALSRAMHNIFATVPHWDSYRREAVAYELANEFVRQIAPFQKAPLLVEEYRTKCDRCRKPLGGMTIYLQDRDGRMTDGRASVLADFVLCSPRCLIAHAEEYGKP